MRVTREREKRHAMSAMPEPLSELELAAIRRRRARITEPPWEYEQLFATWQVYSQARRRRRDSVLDPTHPDHWDIIASNILSTYDGAFIVAAPADYDALLGEIERLRAQVTRLEARLSAMEGSDDER